MIQSTILGFPRMGAKRELKSLVESFWKGTIDEGEFMKGAAELNKSNWALQAATGIDEIPVNDFSIYDQMLDAISMVGAVPNRYSSLGSPVSLTTYFAMARGMQLGQVDLPAMEMKKWFDTNYHYIVPELDETTTFALSTSKVVHEFMAAKALGYTARPVLIGPVSFLLLSKASASACKTFSPLSRLNALLPVYAQVVQQLFAAGAKHIQFDEPSLCNDPADAGTLIAALKETYATLSAAAGNSSELELTIATYFQSPHPQLIDSIIALPVGVLHIDATRSEPSVLEQVVAKVAATQGRVGLSLGLVDGRNVWKVNAAHRISLLKALSPSLKQLKTLKIASSCSLLHSPFTIENETQLDAEVLDWLAFAKEKLTEVVALTAIATALLTESFPASLDPKTAAWLVENDRSNATRQTSARTHDPAVRQRAAAVTSDMYSRASPAQVRSQKQDQLLLLPRFPTTTIGSFPQTEQVRKYRADYKAGRLTDEGYKAAIMRLTKECIETQEQIGLDVLVHGEFERNDMVEFFGEHLLGMAFTANGWVQSYGSRCVKPPIIFGDVRRRQAMTVGMAVAAQALTARPVKGMLTGPVTILQWSFVRDDQPRAETCRQIALAIRDEVADLQAAGIRIIQVDEPAIREGLPLRVADRAAYLRWSVDAYRLATGVAADATQVHSHMCYSDFEEIVDAVAAMDSDVLSIESSRSDLKLLSAFTAERYPGRLGPGLYDIHSPRVPGVQEMLDRAEKMAKYLSPDQLWINPDCGLKTRGWPETKAALANLVEVASILRQKSSTTA